jgi:hypothetical protein
VLLSFVPPKHTQSFSTTLSFAECFEWGSSSKECLLHRGNFRSKLFRIAFFGPAAPLRYSRQGFVPSNCSFRPAALPYSSSAGFGPSNRFLRASSAFVLFECGLRSLELPSSGQQHLRDIRGGASVPRIAFFGPTAPLRYSRQGFGPSNCFFRAGSAFKIFEAGLRPLELFLSGQQRLQEARGGASAPRIVFSV